MIYPEYGKIKLFVNIFLVLWNNLSLSRNLDNTTFINQFGIFEEAIKKGEIQLKNKINEWKILHLYHYNFDLCLKVISVSFLTNFT
jgi:hypothetical protein